MSSSVRNAVPASSTADLCEQCSLLRRTLPAGTNWDGLLAHMRDADLFEVFGLTAACEIDERVLGDAYRAIHRNIHPDRLPRGDDSAQDFALRASAVVNQAYATLKDPVPRAEYLLSRAGGKSASDDKQVPANLLAEVMMIREELEEARGAGDVATLARIKADAIGRRDETAKTIAGLCRQLLASGADIDTVKAALRTQLNAMKYHSNLVNEFESPAAAKR